MNQLLAEGGQAGLVDAFWQGPLARRFSHGGDGLAFEKRSRVVGCDDLLRGKRIFKNGAWQKMNGGAGRVAGSVEGF
ncbi:MAG: hypothetical protein RL077_2849 [Verrucomicrobiota bacterium]